MPNHTFIDIENTDLDREPISYRINKGDILTVTIDGINKQLRATTSFKYRDWTDTYLLESKTGIQYDCDNSPTLTETGTVETIKIHNTD